MADNSAIQAKTESPKSVTDMLWPMPVELINEQMKELCPIVITTIDCLPTKFKDANNNILDGGQREGKVIGPWNETVRGKNYYLGHNYQTEDKALEYYLTSMKEHCDPDSDKC